jgi:hypothetical protein
MDSSKIKVLVVLILASCLAIYLGLAAATAQLEVVSWVGGAVFLIFCVLLGRHIWILIPATLGMQGSFNFIPGSPAPWHLMTAVVGGFTLLRIATRQQRFQLRWTGMETAILLVALTILQAFIRNPTGLSVLGGDVAGGKPYFVYGIAMTAYVLMTTADADLRSWRWAVIAYIGFVMVDSMIFIASGFSPEFARVVIRFYSNVSFLAANTLDYAVDSDEQRITEFGALGVLFGTMASTLWRPISALDIRKPWRAVIALAAILTTLFGGFRSNAARLFVDFCMGSFLRRKPVDVLIVGCIGGMVLGVVIAAMPVKSLPFSIQRILTVVPGIKVRTDILKDTEGSNKFRFDMWKLALTTDRYIKNKWLGDGFQYSASEMRARTAMMFGDYRGSGGMTTEEMFMATGSYHGFHAETIRYTGVVGLLAATGAMIVFAVFAFRCIRHYRDQQAWGVILFICMPFIIHPVWYWVAFGEYRNNFAVLLATAGLVRLLYRNRAASQPALPAVG